MKGKDKMKSAAQTKPIESAEDGVQKRLAEIAAAIKAGKNPARFEKELDRLLGTEMSPRNRAAEAKAQALWEAAGSDE